jgi:uncharacterized protein YdhG (YjbR/CyaY superfamily)
MDKPEAGTFEDYLDHVPDNRAEGTRSIIAAMRKLLPDAEENVRWGIAVFSHDGEDITGISARKNYFSLYVPDPDVLEQYAPELGKVNPGNGCIRFARLKDIKLPVLRRMVKELRRRAFSV